VFNAVLLRQINQQLGRALVDLSEERLVRQATVPAPALADCLLGIDSCSAKVTAAQAAVQLAIAAVDSAMTLIASHG